MTHSGDRTPKGGTAEVAVPPFPSYSAGMNGRRTNGPPPRRLAWLVPALGLLVAGGDCGDGTDGDEALFVVRACRGSEHAPGGEEFRVLIRDPDVIAEAQSRIGLGPGRILSGRVVEGDGGFNAPWSWHLDPGSIVFTDVAPEFCDGCPSFVEDDLPYWAGTVEQFCPWGTEVLAREG